MTESIQGIDTIAPMPGAKGKTPDDPAQADYEEGKRFLENGKLSQAALSLHNALMAFEEAADQNGVANASNQLGNVCLERKEFEKSLGYYEKAWEICEKMEDPMSLLALSGQLIKVHCGLKDYSKSISIALDMLDAYGGNNDPKGTVEVLEMIVDVYLASGEKRKAADSCRTIASIHANFNHKQIAAEFSEKADKLELEA